MAGGRDRLKLQGVGFGSQRHLGLHPPGLPLPGCGPSGGAQPLPPCPSLEAPPSGVMDERRGMDWVFLLL